MTMRDKSELLRDRYYLMIGPLLLLIGVSIGSTESSSRLLAGVATTLLVALTLNKLLWTAGMLHDSGGEPN